MSARAAAPAVALRVSVLALLAGLALAQVSAPILPRPAGAITLAVLAFREGLPSPIAEDVLPRATEYRFTGTVSKRCHLFVFSMDWMGQVWRLGAGAAEDEPGPLVGPGAFSVPGGFAFEPTRAVRIWAVCGSANLRFRQIADTARSEVASLGRGEEALSSVTRLEWLPADVIQTSRFFRFAF